MDSGAVQHIFGTILGAFCARHLGPDGGLAAACGRAVEATAALYAAARAELLPTPAKAHYGFNLRDVAKV